MVEPNLPLGVQDVKGVCIIEGVLALLGKVSTMLFFEGITEESLELLLRELNGRNEFFSNLDLIDLEQRKELCQEDLDRSHNVS